MAISSMTGFARTTGAHEGVGWTWEVRSVNGRGLDCRLRLPPGYDALEAPVRDAMSGALSRGNVSATLTLDRTSTLGSLRLNETVLRDVVRAADRAIEIVGGTRPDTAQLLSIKGVLDTADVGERDAATITAEHAALLAGATAAVADLVAARRGEGAQLATVLEAHVVDIAGLAKDIRNAPSRQPDAVRKRLAEQLRRLTDQRETLDVERLHQEAVLIATRGDVEEELARLDAHVAAARDLLAATSPSGRKLDFLAQEFNREANTICSKALGLDVTRAGLALKAVIDQLREQVQNVE